MDNGQGNSPSRPALMASALRFTMRLLDARLRGPRPLFVNIEPTHRCNLSCSFCNKTSAGAAQMETGRALQLIDDLAAAGTCSVCFDGGEPLFHPNIGDMIARANKRGLQPAFCGAWIPGCCADASDCPLEDAAPKGRQVITRVLGSLNLYIRGAGSSTSDRLDPNDRSAQNRLTAKTAARLFAQAPELARGTTCLQRESPCPTTDRNESAPRRRSPKHYT
jgi:hypothetical protein